jgi:hypothetical protein
MPDRLFVRIRDGERTMQTSPVRDDLFHKTREIHQTPKRIETEQRS